MTNPEPVPAQGWWLRWAVRATLTIGVAASVAANILHAAHNPISQAIAAWPPLALLLTVELVSRVPIHRWSLATARIAATVIIASIATWVSYWHMAAVAATYGENPTTAHLLPISVDGLIIVASISLVELGTHPARRTAVHTGRSTVDGPTMAGAAAALVPAPAADEPPAPGSGFGRVTR
jgi:hypothetical protein